MKETAVRWLLWILAKQGNPAIIPWAFRQIRRLFQDDPERYHNFLWSLHRERSDDWLIPFFVAHEIGELIDYFTEDVIDLLFQLSGHEHEMVRQGAARSWSKLLEYDFERFFPEIEKLSNSENYELRHTAALAPVRYFQETELMSRRKQKLISFWESYADDSRQGLSNLVESQILEKQVYGD